MKKFYLAAIAALTMAHAGGDVMAVAYAPVVPIEEPKFYIGGAYTQADTSVETQSYRIIGRNDGFTLIGGYVIHENLDVTGRYTWLSTENIGANQRITGESWGIHLKPKYNVKNMFTIYALSGYGETFIEDGTGDIVNGDGDFQYGLGLEFTMKKNFLVFIDYVAVYDESAASISGRYLNADVENVTLGLAYKF